MIVTLGQSISGVNLLKVYAVFICAPHEAARGFKDISVEREI